MPLRLSVFIEAPQASIDAVIQKHGVVRELVHNHWIHLFQITPDSRTISNYRVGIWEPVKLNHFNPAKEETTFTREAYA